MVDFLLQIGKDVNSPTSLWEVVEPFAALAATTLVILITFYMSNLKHDLLDEWLVEKHHRMRRKSPYAKLMKYLFRRHIFRVNL